MPHQPLLEVDKLVTLQYTLRTTVDSFVFVLQGCYDAISGPMNAHAWGVAWFGFAILCWTVSLVFAFISSSLVLLFHAQLGGGGCQD